MRYRINNTAVQMQNEMLRVVILLRASSKKPTDQEHDFDIPQQKSILVQDGATDVENKERELTELRFKT